MKGGVRQKGDKWYYYLDLGKLYYRSNFKNNCINIKNNLIYSYGRYYVDNIFNSKKYNFVMTWENGKYATEKLTNLMEKL